MIVSKKAREVMIKFVGNFQMSFISLLCIRIRKNYTLYTNPKFCNKLFEFFIKLSNKISTGVTFLFQREKTRVHWGFNFWYYHGIAISAVSTFRKKKLLDIWTRTGNKMAAFQKFPVSFVRHITYIYKFHNIEPRRVDVW